MCLLWEYSQNVRREYSQLRLHWTELNDLFPKWRKTSFLHRVEFHRECLSLFTMWQVASPKKIQESKADVELGGGDVYSLSSCTGSRFRLFVPTYGGGDSWAVKWCYRYLSVFPLNLSLFKKKKKKSHKPLDMVDLTCKHQSPAVDNLDDNNCTMIHWSPPYKN